MIDHFGINCSDWAKSQQFYDAVLGVLGFSRQMDFGVAIGYGRDASRISGSPTPARGRPRVRTVRCISPSRPRTPMR
jgi:catechol 2,3-dioxygenase-like lactoylglutathione lyase family enzyme